MTIVVVGAEGFIGSALLAHLSALGADVAVATRDEPLRSLDLGQLNPAAIIWAAGSVTPSIAARSPSESSAALASFRDAVDHIQTSAPNCRFLLTSSGGSVYTSPPPHSELSSTNGHTAFADLALKLEADAQRLKRCTAVRVSNVYGPGQRARRGLGVIAHWVSAAKEGRCIELFGDGTAERDFVFIDDAAQALIGLAMHDDELPPVVNVGSGAPTQLLDVLDALGVVAPSNTVDVEHREHRDGVDRQSTYLDVKLIRSLTGWEPTTSLAEGIAQTWTEADVG